MNWTSWDGSPVLFTVFPIIYRAEQHNQSINLMYSVPQLSFSCIGWSLDYRQFGWLACCSLYPGQQGPFDSSPTHHWLEARSSKWGVASKLSQFSVLEMYVYPSWLHFVHCLFTAVGELARILNCKGRVFAMDDEPDVPRMWLPDQDAPGLAMARAFGDFCLKNHGLICTPEVYYRKLSEKDEFLVLATDGVINSFIWLAVSDWRHFHILQSYSKWSGYKIA